MIIAIKPFGAQFLAVAYEKSSHEDDNDYAMNIIQSWDGEIAAIKQRDREGAMAYHYEFPTKAARDLAQKQFESDEFLNSVTSR